MQIQKSTLFAIIFLLPILIKSSSNLTQSQESPKKHMTYKLNVSQPIEIPRRDINSFNYFEPVYDASRSESPNSPSLVTKYGVSEAESPSSPPSRRNLQLLFTEYKKNLNNITISPNYNDNSTKPSPTSLLAAATLMNMSSSPNINPLNKSQK